MWHRGDIEDYALSAFSSRYLDPLVSTSIYTMPEEIEPCQYDYTAAHIYGVHIPQMPVGDERCDDSSPLEVPVNGVRNHHVLRRTF